MSYLNRIKRHPKSRKNPIRAGRGPGSGTGKTSGSGHKGQLAHGKPPRMGFEGGQMPIIRTMPKRGFSARAVVKYQVLNVSDLSGVAANAVVDIAYLVKNGFVSSMRLPVKVLGEGELSKAVHVKANAFSRSAIEKIEKAGGKCERVAK